MKKLILAVAAIVGLAATAHAQEGLKLGANVGVPFGDYGDLTSLSVGLDVAYLVEVSDSFYLGGATGFTNAFGKDYSDSFMGIEYSVEIPDIQFLPVAAAARYFFTDEFFAGADLGYAVGINDGNDGGIYYRPKVGYTFTDLIGANLSYTGISKDGSSVETINLGVEFSF